MNLISSGKIAVDRKSMTMEEFLDDYIERQGKSRKPATVAVWKQVVANLKELALTQNLWVKGSNIPRMEAFGFFAFPR
ncbi:MAG: hypothetical protein LW720_18095 [Pirellula sp.]|nr:hypothetical protein [Pirellula sp.]